MPACSYIHDTNRKREEREEEREEGGRATDILRLVGLTLSSVDTGLEDCILNGMSAAGLLEEGRAYLRRYLL